MRVERFSIDGAFETTEFEPTSGSEELYYQFDVGEDTQSFFLSVTPTGRRDNEERGPTQVDLGQLEDDNEFAPIHLDSADQDLVSANEFGGLIHYAEIEPAERSLLLRIHHEGEPGAVVSLTQVKRGFGRRLLDKLKGITKCRACIALVAAIIRFIIAKATGGLGNLIDFDLPSIEVPDSMIDKLSEVFGVDQDTLKRILDWLDKLRPSPIKDLAKRICNKLGLC